MSGAVALEVGETDQTFGQLTHDVIVPAAAGATVLWPYDMGEDMEACPVPSDIVVEEVPVLAWRVQVFRKVHETFTLSYPVCCESDSADPLAEVFPMPDGTLRDPGFCVWDDRAAMLKDMLDYAVRRRKLVKIQRARSVRLRGKPGA